MIKVFDRYFFGSVHALRPRFLVRVFLFVLAFDAWTELTTHGGRYGHGGFNVAHFPWLDTLQPTPSPALYVGVVTLVGLLALGSAFGPLMKPVLGAIALLYTWAWAMSMIDSYQHHYLLSLILVLFVFLPVNADTGANEDLEGRRTTSWSWHLLTTTVALVYAWTAVSKFEPDWRNGTALRRIAGEPLRSLHAWLGADPAGFDAFVEALSPTVGLLQIVIAIGYLSVPLAPRWNPARLLTGAGGIAATLFHLGAEWLDLQIGWFSTYMLIVACVVFTPDSVCDRVARAWTVPSWWSKRSAASGDASSLVFSAALGAGALLIVVGRNVDLPGVPAATSIVAGAAFLTGFRWDIPKRSIQLSLSAAIAAVGLMGRSPHDRRTIRLLPVLGWRSVASGCVGRRPSCLRTSQPLRTRRQGPAARGGGSATAGQASTGQLVVEHNR